ncbi:MAG TPA: glucan biosynthesis protein G [Verrucomicrobiae bacterium]|jgi:glucans biosynthesis protein
MWIKITAGAFLAGAVISSQAQTPAGFSFSTVREMALALSAKDFRPADNSSLPDSLKKLTFDEYQKIRFRPEHNLWKNDHVRFMAQFFQRGYLYQDPVVIHVVDEGKVRDVNYSPEDFDYNTNRVPNNLPPTLQFGGFRLLYPMNSPQKMDEAAEFLGASYFRTLGGLQRYGSSERGLAIDTAESSGEEFPRFTEFWLEKPPQLAGGIRVYALLDSPSVAGAYRFVIEPGAVTVTEVEASLFFRKSPKKIGLAPLGSLFLVGQNHERSFPDYRPQVHDSDGLQIQSGDSNWVWRPLVNPAKTFRVTRFPVSDLKGFGLMQRDRNFADYDDLQCRFELRPSYWVEPIGPWQPGAVELVEIPTPNDYNDNIVAYWVPSEKPQPGQEMHFTYRVSALLNGPERGPLLRVQSTRIQPEVNGRPPRFVLDFAGAWPQPASITSAEAARIFVSQGRAQNLVIQTNEAIGGWQVFFDLAGAGDSPAELRMFLQPGREPASETWLYNYQKSN